MTIEKEWVSTPEEMILKDIASIDTSRLSDPINTALSRALAVINLIQGDGSDLKHGFTFEHQIIMDALWAVEGGIKQALLLNSIKNDDSKEGLSYAKHR